MLSLPGDPLSPPELVISRLPELLRHPSSEHSENQSPTERATDGVQRGPRLGSLPLIPNNYSPKPALFSCKVCVTYGVAGADLDRGWASWAPGTQ